MRVVVGTSGYSYREWKGPFYPRNLSAARYLAFYASELPTVEVNSTFYRMPTAQLVASWARDVPESFTFAIKAPQRITHTAKLENVAETVEELAAAVRGLGTRLGPVLFQLPPFLRKDVPRLTDFLSRAPKGLRIAFEFRHPSWFDDRVWAALRAAGAALCVAESEKLECPLVATAPWGYVRLRRDSCPDEWLAGWAEKIRAQPWSEAFVYLKHDEGDAPSAAKRLIDALGADAARAHAD